MENVKLNGDLTKKLMENKRKTIDKNTDEILK